MTKLNEIVALSNGLKGRTQTEITNLHRMMGHTGGMLGLTRTYKPRDEEGERLPSEQKLVQYRASDILNDAMGQWKTLWELVLEQDYSNSLATADIVVDGKVLVTQVPVTTMLWLLKQLDDMKTFAQNIPVVDPSQEWSYSNQTNCYVTPATETTRTKKIPRNHVKAEATKEHPAQVEIFSEDVVVGYWNKVDHSGAMLASDKAMYLEKIAKVQDAVKVAKEQANGLEITRVERLSDLFNYLN